MSNYFKMLVFVVIICFFLGCSKNAELSLTQLLGKPPIKYPLSLYL